MLLKIYHQDCQLVLQQYITMWSPLRKIGNNAETVAEKFLHKRGLKTITTNYLSKIGEIDLIMQDDSVIVFIEVRYRLSANFTSSVESVDVKKQRKIIKTAELFLQKNPKYQDSICRFDVVGLENSLKSPTINWITNAFTL